MTGVGDRDVWTPVATRNNPVFKKPMNYDPALAQHTLAHVGNTPNKKNRLLADLGLADEEGIDLEDSDEFEDEDDSAPQPELSCSTVSISTDVVVGREQDVTRHGLEAYRRSLLHSLAAFASQGTQHAGSKTQIDDLGKTLPALVLELQMMIKENAELQEAVDSRPEHTDTLLEQYEEDMQQLRARVKNLEQDLRSRDDTMQQLQSQLQAAVNEARNATALLAEAQQDLHVFKAQVLSCASESTHSDLVTARIEALPRATSHQIAAVEPTMVSKTSDFALKIKELGKQLHYDHEDDVEQHKVGNANDVDPDSIHEVVTRARISLNGAALENRVSLTSHMSNLAGASHNHEHSNSENNSSTVVLLQQQISSLQEQVSTLHAQLAERMSREQCQASAPAPETCPATPTVQHDSAAVATQGPPSVISEMAAGGNTSSSGMNSGAGSPTKADALTCIGSHGHSKPTNGHQHKQHAEAASSGVSVEALQAALAMKDKVLQRAVEEVEDYRRAGQLTESEAFAGQIRILMEQLDKASSERDAVLAEVSASAQKLQALESEITEKESEFKEQMRKLESEKDAQHLVALNKQLWNSQSQHTQRENELASEIKLLKTQLQQARNDNAKAADAAAARLRQAEQQFGAKLKSELETVKKQLRELHEFREGILADLVAMQQEMFNENVQKQMMRMVRDKEIAMLKRAQADAQALVNASEEKAKAAQEAFESREQDLERQLKILRIESVGQIKLFKEKWAAEFEKRKKLHNQVLELRGNIRVLCRVRPALPREQESGDATVSSVKVLTEEVMRIATDKGDREFEFDRVFSPAEDQGTVFQEVEALVTSVLDGYHVCIMAYGQTGSGKTFTMEGPDDNPGLNARALKELFRLAEDRSQDWTYTFSASVLEIYNEKIYDLLAGGRDQDADTLDVKQGPDGMFVPGLRIEAVNCSDDVAAVIARGKTNRSTFATNMNEHSSRSHLVLSVYVLATSKGSAPAVRGKLHLIDLAGSERLSRSGAQGDRLKEAQNINKSLSALGDVIAALQQKAAHVPYRNSKLTRLLEDSLGSSNKCVMVVNVSPTGDSVPETKCSLEFASRARKVELGKAKVLAESQFMTRSVPSTPRISGSGAAPMSAPSNLSRVNRVTHSETGSAAVQSGGSARNSQTQATIDCSIPTRPGPRAGIRRF